MATERTQYPIRLDISQQGPAVEAAPVPVLRRAGGAVGPAVATVARNLPSVLMADAARRGAVATQGSAADFWEGLFGMPQGALPRAANTRLNPDYVPVAGRQAEATPKTAAAKKAAETLPKEPTGNARASSTMTPQDQLIASVANVLSRPHSLRQLQAVAGVLPAATKSTVDPKSQMLSDLADIDRRMFQDQLAAAQTPEETLIALEDQRRRLLEGGGQDPTKQALAILLAQASQGGGD